MQDAPCFHCLEKNEKGMGILVGIIAKAILLSLLLAAVGLVVVRMVKGVRPGPISLVLVVILFLFLAWQGTLLFGGLRLKGYEERVLMLGEASISDIEALVQVLPLPSEFQSKLSTSDLSVSEMETVKSFRKSTNNYIMKRLAWIVILEIAAVVLMCLVDEDVPKKKIAVSSHGYGHYLPTDDF